MTAIERAIAEVAAVARALARLPDRRGTAPEIAAACGLPLAIVTRRLKGSSAAVCAGACRVFAVLEHGGYWQGRHRKTVWGLTERGRELSGEE